jgi:lipoprotein-anchoring transpeptidase ErfK/SrfK
VIFNMKTSFYSILLTTALALGLSSCKYETFADPALNAVDAKLIAEAPQPPKGFDPYRARYRLKDPTGEAPGTIVVDTDARFLYLVEEGGNALRYPIAPGAEAYQWRGSATIGRKAEWPSWTPGPEARRLSPGLPATVPGGSNSPLGSRGLYLFEGNKDTQYRIHGTNDPQSIGHAESLGCIRMHNIDVIDLYNRVKTGTKVVVR